MIPGRLTGDTAKKFQTTVPAAAQSLSVPVQSTPPVPAVQLSSPAETQRKSAIFNSCIIFISIVLFAICLKIAVQVSASIGIRPRVIQILKNGLAHFLKISRNSRPMHTRTIPVYAVATVPDPALAGAPDIEVELTVATNRDTSTEMDIEEGGFRATESLHHRRLVALLQYQVVA
jgi:hypothetical protein